MTLSRKELDALVDEGADEIRHDVPDTAACEQAAERALGAALARLASEPATADTHDTIRSCDDVRALLGAYVAGELPEAKSLLIQDHTRECLPCRRALMAAREGRKVAQAAPSAWSPEQGADTADRAPANRWWAAAAAVAVVGLGLAVLMATGLIGGPGTVYAQVDSIDGGLYLVDEEGSRALSAGDSVRRGDEVRTARGSGAVLTLNEGSRVEMRERTAVSLHEGRQDATVDLARGSVIVEASKRSRGHLYVDTQDCRVAVTGTIFSVNHGTKGSRVSVIEGSVRVEQGRSEELLQPGEQVTTRAYLAAVPLSEEISWSRDVDRYLALLAEINAIQQEIRRTVPAHLPRTSTRLLDLAPAGTAIYAAVPNVAESLSEARRVFNERLAESPVLSEVLSEAGNAEHQRELDELFERIRDYGSFLGDEVAFALVGTPEADEPSGVAFAQVLEPEAFRTFLEQEVAVFGADAPIHLVSDPSEAVAGSSGIYLWLTDGYVVAATGAESLAAMATSLGGGASFTGSSLHGAVTDAYADGVEWLIAVDLESVMDEADEAPEDLFGFEDARHLLAQWSEAGERSAARAVVTFDGPRHGVASWLAAPAPMGSLEYVTGDAAAAAAFVVRDPAEMVDEMMATLLDRDPQALADFERLQQEQGLDLRADLAEPLGGEMAIALDGPLAPQPSFKAVIEVYDPARLQLTLETLVERLDEMARAAGALTGAGGGFALTSEQAGGRTYHRISTPAAAVAGYYTYDDAYLVATPSRALLDTALAARASGANLPSSQAFRDLLPADGYTNFSAVVYQDLGSRLAPLAKRLADLQEGNRELTAEERATLEETAALHPPTLGYAYGEEDRIVFAASLGEGSFLMKAVLGAGGLGGATGMSGLEGLMAGLEPIMAETAP
jgi:ferric-dicitrate binding protein FerR (iron transport regulator)